MKIIEPSVELINAPDYKTLLTTMDSKLDKQQAVMETKMDELTREVREHNNFAKRMPVVEEQIKVINHRIEDLEEYHKGA